MGTTEHSGEHAQFKAKYESGRKPTGQFERGHSFSKGRNLEINKKLSSLRSMWYDCVTPEDLASVYDELLNMIRTCEVADVKLKAIVYYVDRCAGKPTENIQVDVNTESTALNLHLSADQLALASELSSVLNKYKQPTETLGAESDVIDATFTALPEALPVSDKPNDTTLS